MRVSALRVYAPLTVSVSSGLAALALLLCLLMLRVVIGPFALGEAPEPVARRAPRVALFEPASLRAAPEYERARRLEQWRALLAPQALAGVVGALPAPAAGEIDAVIVSDARWMDDAEVARLREWVGSGGAALLAGWVGVRAGEDWAAGERRMARLLEVPGVERLARDASFFAAAGARGPLSSGLLPGEKAALAPDPDVPALALPDAEIIWATSALRPAEGAAVGAARRLEIGAGRLAWLAPTPEAASVTAAAQRWMAALVERALGWAARRPSGEMLAWPDGAPAAALLAMDSEDRFENAAGVAEAAAREGFPVTFLVLTQVGERFPEVLARLAQVGEIGSHADVHEGFEGLAEGEQARRLARSRDALRALGVAEPIAFRAPYESYDEATLRAAREVGFRVVLGDRDPASMTPRLLALGGDGPPLVQVPRVARDDYDLFVREALAGGAELERAMRSDFARVSGAGGLYYFSFHTQYLGDPERVEALARVERAMRESGAWRATAGEIADWWLRRAGCRASFTPVGPSRIRVAVSNEGERAARGLVVRIHANAPLRAAEASRTRVFQPAARISLTPGQGFLDLALPALEAGASEAFDVDLAALPGPLAAR